MPVMKKLEETVAVIKEYYSYSPEVGIVLGSGLGNVDMVSALHWRLSRMKNGELPYSRPKNNAKMEVIAKFFINFKRFRSIIECWLK